MGDYPLEAYSIENLYDLTRTIGAQIFRGHTYPWEVLPGIGNFIRTLGETLDPSVYEKTDGEVWIARSAKVAPTACINGPCIIGEDTEVRHCAFIRGNALVGRGAVVGNSTELKNVILFDGVQVPHYNYVGDSILGYKAHMGAGSITSNVKSDKQPVTVNGKAFAVDTGLKKFGAMVGDHVEVGCNAVLNPGTVIGRYASIYPTSCVRGCIPENHIYKDRQHIVMRRMEKES